MAMATETGVMQPQVKECWQSEKLDEARDSVSPEGVQAC